MYIKIEDKILYTRNKYKVGDRVLYMGNRATVKTVSKISNVIGIKFDEQKDNRLLEIPVPSSVLEKINDRKMTIVIKRNGDTITAYMGKKQAVAKCSPKDDFDLFKGAILALTRLLIEEE